MPTTFQIETVTPEDAAKLLRTSRQGDKGYRVQAFNRLKLAIETGTWDPELSKAKPVIIVRGRLRNGNHRMRAIIASGQTVQVWVQRQSHGLPGEERHRKAPLQPFKQAH